MHQAPPEGLGLRLPVVPLVVGGRVERVPQVVNEGEVAVSRDWEVQAGHAVVSGDMPDTQITVVEASDPSLRPNHKVCV